MQNNPQLRWLFGLGKQIQASNHLRIFQNNDMEGTGTATIWCHNKITQPIPSTKRKRKPLRNRFSRDAAHV